MGKHKANERGHTRARKPEVTKEEGKCLSILVVRRGKRGINIASVDLKKL